jgi:hypothetical protein
VPVSWVLERPRLAGPPRARREGQATSDPQCDKRSNAHRIPDDHAASDYMSNSRDAGKEISSGIPGREQNRTWLSANNKLIPAGRPASGIAC